MWVTEEMGGIKVIRKDFHLLQFSKLNPPKLASIVYELSIESGSQCLSRCNGRQSPHLSGFGKTMDEQLSLRFQVLNFLV